MEAAVVIGYRYGLRRGEILGLQPQDVKKGYLKVERQVLKSKVGEPIKYELLKDRESRQVAHLWLTPLECAGFVKTLTENLTTQSQLGHFFLLPMMMRPWSFDLAKMAINNNFHFY